MDRLLQKHNHLRQVAKKEMLTKLHYPAWSQCNISQKAKFLANYEYSSKRRKYVIRANKRSISVVKKQLRHMAKMMKKRGSMMGRRRRHVYASVRKHAALLCDLNNSAAPETVMTKLLSNSKRKKLDLLTAQSISSFFLRPDSIALYQGTDKFLVVKEEEGLYTFEAKLSTLARIENNLKAFMTEEGVKFKFKLLDVSEDPEHTAALSNILG